MYICTLFEREREGKVTFIKLYISFNLVAIYLLLFAFDHEMSLFTNTHGYVSVVTSSYLVEEVSGSHPGWVILKMLKIVPTAALFGVEHIKVRLGTVITFSC